MGFDGSHPVASVAARLCRAEHGHAPSFEDVACGDCWEAAVLADKETAAEHGLPEVCPVDPDLVDEVVVERAVAGEPVELTVAEWVAAKRVVADRRGIGFDSAGSVLASHIAVVDNLGNRLSVTERPLAVRRSRRRAFPRAQWSRSDRRSARRAVYVAAIQEPAARAA